MLNIGNPVPLAWAFLLIAGLAYAADWDYSDGSHGPGHWKDSNPKCGLQSQSPIDLKSSKTDYDSTLKEFTFTGYDTPSPNAKPMLKNNGHTAVVELTDGDYSIKEGGLPGTYKAAQFHFHWGSENNKGSEHLVDGKAYPLEMHIVHYSDQYSNLGAAVTQDEGLAVLGTFFEVSGSDNPAYKDLIKQLASVSHDDDEILLSNFALKPLLPSDTKMFYRYNGSLTTPTCDESVIWTVFQTTVKISQGQMDKFRNLYENEDGEPDKAMVNNYRPVQSLNGRSILTTNKDLTARGSAGPTISLALLLAVIFLCQSCF